MIQQEILLQQQFFKHGLTTPIIEAFYCDQTNTSYIITLPKQSTLFQLCNDLAASCGYKFTCIEAQEKLNMIVMLLQRAIDSIMLAHQYGLYHRDTHLHNFMTDISVDDIDDKCNQAVQSLQFIDFGYSIQSKSNDEELAEYDIGLFVSSVMDSSFGISVYPLLNLYQFQEQYDEFYGCKTTSKICK
jgi:hypothetical protein